MLSARLFEPLLSWIFTLMETYGYKRADDINFLNDLKNGD